MTDGRRNTDETLSWLPRGWRMQPAEPDWRGRRYTSPDGYSKLSIFTTDVGDGLVSDQMKETAFRAGEQLSYLRGERDWIVVSGIKDAHVFYRKASLACGGRNWHRIEFEYPVEEKKHLDALVTTFSRRLELYNSAGCEPAVASQATVPPSPPQADSPQ
jgi:hypothetical protein